MSNTALTETEQPLILTGSGYGIEIAPEYQEKKETLLKHSALIVEVKDQTADLAADNQIKKLAAMRIEVEKSRKAVKEPALVFGKTVDQQAKDFSEEIEAEESRLKKCRGEYAQAVAAERARILREVEEKRRKEEAERKATEAKRIEEERIAEEARKKAEEDLWNADTEEDQQAAQEKLAAVEPVAPAPAPVTVVSAPTFIPAAPKGVKMVPNFEVEDIHALYRAYPNLVTLTERRKEVLETITANMDGDELPSIPGLRVFMEPKVSSR